MFMKQQLLIVLFVIVVICILQNNHNNNPSALADETNSTNNNVNISVCPECRSTLDTNSGVYGPRCCRKSAAGTFAVCGSNNNIPIKFFLSPFSYAAKANVVQANIRSCDIYERPSPITDSINSRILCAKGASSPGIWFYDVTSFYRQITLVLSSNLVGNFPVVVIDSAADGGNGVAYLSSDHPNHPSIHKVSGISTNSPSHISSVTIGDAESSYPVGSILFDGFMYTQLTVISPEKITRVRLSDFTWNGTVNLNQGTGAQSVDNLAHDGKNYVYSLIPTTGNIVRCLHTEASFSCLDSLAPGFAHPSSISASPDSRYLAVTSYGSNCLFLVSVATFQVISGTTTTGIPYATGSPLITTNNTIYTFGHNVENVYMIQVKETPSSGGAASSSEEGECQCTEFSSTGSSSASGGGGGSPAAIEGGGGGATLGIIVGAVIGGVVLLAIIALIVAKSSAAVSSSGGGDTSSEMSPVLPPAPAPAPPHPHSADPVMISVQQQRDFDAEQIRQIVERNRHNDQDQDQVFVMQPAAPFGGTSMMMRSISSGGGRNNYIQNDNQFNNVSSIRIEGMSPSGKNNN